MPLVESAVFPAGVAAVGNLLNQKDKVPSQADPTLDAGIDADDLTIALASGTGARLPADNFLVSIDDEILLIDSRTSDTLTVNASGRGYQSTSGAAHSAGAAVRPYITAKHHNQVAAEVNAIETELGANLVHVFKTTVTPLSSDTTLDASHGVVAVTTGAGTKTMTLPTAVGIKDKMYVIKKVDSGAGKVIVAGSIDGFTNWELLNQNQYVVIISDNAAWLVIGNN